jgi:hypothetical protein
MQNGANIRKLTKEAKKLYAAAEKARALVESGVTTSLEKAWQCGKRLNAIKEIIGHGNWLTWLEGNWPKLGHRSAQRYMSIDLQNPNATRVSDLKFDSIRKYAIGFVPEKERLEQKGDKKFDRPTHYSSVLGECNKLRQRIEAGQSRDDRDEMQREFSPFFTWLYGEVPKKI